MPWIDRGGSSSSRFGLIRFHTILVFACSSTCIATLGAINAEFHSVRSRYSRIRAGLAIAESVEGVSITIYNSVCDFVRLLPECFGKFLATIVGGLVRVIHLNDRVSPCCRIVRLNVWTHARHNLAASLAIVLEEALVEPHVSFTQRLLEIVRVADGDGGEVGLLLDLDGLALGVEREGFSTRAMQEHIETHTAAKRSRHYETSGEDAIASEGRIIDCHSQTRSDKCGQ